MHSLEDSNQLTRRVLVWRRQVSSSFCVWYCGLWSSELETGKQDQIPWQQSLISRDLVFFPVSIHFNFSKVSGNRKNDQIPWKNDYCQGILSFLLFIDTFWIQKCLETEKQPNPLKKTLFSRDLVVLPVSRHFWIQKVSKNRRNDKIPWQ